MALKPGRPRNLLPPLIAKGLLYPLRNRRASKLATHGFASISQSHHNNAKALPQMMCFSMMWASRKRNCKRHLGQI